MTKSDLEKRLARKFSEIEQKDAKELIVLFLEAMRKGLASGDTVELRDFGVLRIRKKGPRKARNPRTGQTVMVGAKKIVYFKQSRILKKKFK